MDEHMDTVLEREKDQETPTNASASNDIVEMQAESCCSGSEISNVPQLLNSSSKNKNRDVTNLDPSPNHPAPVFGSHALTGGSEAYALYQQPLLADEIRLLHISPDSDQDSIVCTTSCHKLHTLPAYVALSYSWGFVDVSYTITVDGHDFLVSKAVHTGLKSLRQQAMLDACDRNVWIDAICINQSDLEEKTQQVRMMSKIYQYATLVVAWLGEMTEKERRGFSLIASVSSKLQLENIYTQNDAQIREESLQNTTDLAEQIGLPYVGHLLWEDVHEIFNKPWWSRVWIIQELLFAQQFVFLCGDTIFESETLLNFAGNMVKYPFLQNAMVGPRGKPKGVSSASSLAQWREMWLGGAQMNMTLCLLKAVFSEATDSRDKIFALVHLSSDIDGSFIDYKKTLRQVLIDLAWHHLTSEAPRMDVLSMVQMFHRPEGVPSWVPCWSEQGGAGSAGLAFIGFSAGKQKIKIPARADIHIDAEDALVIHSQQLDTIAAVLHSQVESEVPPIPLGAQRSLGNPEFHAWFCGLYEHDYQQRVLHLELAELTEALGSYPTGQPIEEVYWRSQIMDDQHTFPVNILHAYQQLNREAMEEIIPQNICTEMELYERIQSGERIYSGEVMRLGQLYEDQARDYQMKQVAVCEYSDKAKLTKERKYAITEKGYVAWVPETAEVGDQLHIIAGARVPYLLREVEGRALDGSEAVELLGDTYVHGLMMGLGIYETGILGESRQLRII